MCCAPCSNWVMMNKETRRLSKYPDEVRAELEQYYLDTPPIIEGDTKNEMELDKSVEYVRKGLLVSYIPPSSHNKCLLLGVTHTLTKITINQ